MPVTSMAKAFSYLAEHRELPSGRGRASHIRLNPRTIKDNPMSLNGIYSQFSHAEIPIKWMI